LACGTSTGQSADSILSSIEAHFRPVKVDEEKDFMLSMDTRFKGIAAVTIPLIQEDGAKDVKRKQRKPLKFSGAWYYRVSIIMDSRKHSNRWNVGIRIHLHVLRIMLR
jgi:hypothetical protein